MNAVNSSEAVPSSREFTFLGATYGLYGLGLFLIWPTLIGLILAYVKRHDVPVLLSSHYRWLITTFWWWLFAWASILVAMLVVIVPNALEIESAVESEQYFNIPWELIGAGTIGGLALAFVWFWVVYRLVRGAIRLSDGRAAPSP
ncbi:MAG: hypothetical protein ABJA83_09445 [Burkholderiaceae bacterium]